MRSLADIVAGGRRGVPLVALVLAAAIVVIRFAGPASAGPVEPMTTSGDGRWFVDAAGRVVVFHGVNIVPPGPGTTPGEAGIGRAHLRFLRRQGFRLVRLGAFYADVEPMPGRYDLERLRATRRYQRQIGRAGMFGILDFHQDLYSPRYGGRGFPEWMVIDDGAPNQVNAGFPAGYLVNVAANRAYDSFWADRRASDGVGIQTHFVRGWRRMAKMMARGRPPRLLGYDIFNEPWPGTPWVTCANPLGCPPGGFDQAELTAFTRRVIGSIRKADRRRIVFAEPNLQFDFGADTGLGDPGDSNAGLSFHDYCLATIPGAPAVPDPLGLCEIGETLVMDNAQAYGRRFGVTPILTEFGDSHDPAIHERVTRIADERMLSWAMWGYWAANGQIVRDPARPPTPDNLEQGVLDAVVRPYPYVVAGTPLGWEWDPDRRRFGFRYATELAAERGRAPEGSVTEVVVPRRSFPAGYEVVADGASVVSGPDAGVLRLVAERGENRVRVAVEGRRLAQSRAPRKPDPGMKKAALSGGS